MNIITQDMITHFKYRTGYHLWCVHKWSNKILKRGDLRINEYPCATWVSTKQLNSEDAREEIHY